MFKKSRVLVLLIGLGGASAYFALELQAKQVDEPALHEQVLEVLREQRDVISRPLADLPRNFN